MAKHKPRLSTNQMTGIYIRNDKVLMGKYLIKILNMMYCDLQMQRYLPVTTCVAYAARLPNYDSHDGSNDQLHLCQTPTQTGDSVATYHAHRGDCPMKLS